MVRIEMLSELLSLMKLMTLNLHVH